MFMHHITTQLKSCGCFKDYYKNSKKQRHYFDEKTNKHFSLESDMKKKKKINFGMKMYKPLLLDILQLLVLKTKHLPTTTYMCAGVNNKSVHY